MKIISVPGSKSISNRVLLLASLSDKKIILNNLLESDDTVYMRNVLSEFGVKFKDLSRNSIEVDPCNFNLNGNYKDLFIGNAGTAARFLSCLSLLLEEKQSFVLNGIKRMEERPQKDLFKALNQVGVDIKCLKKKDFLPAKFSKKEIDKETKTQCVKISGKVSSQFISGLLLVAGKMENGLKIIVQDEIPSWPYIKMTLDILKIWKIKFEVSNDKKSFIVFPDITSPSKYDIPSDMSSASYPIAWSILKKEKICINNFGENTLQGDEGFLDIAKKTGAKIERAGDKCFIYPSNKIKSLGNVDFSAMPDVSMTGMILASIADGESYFTGLESLRVKECDRIIAMKQLKNFGIKFEINGDDVRIIGNPNLLLTHKYQNLIIDSYDDHRIAMCFGILRMGFKLGADFYNNSWFKISDLNCVAKTWPNFWLDFANIEEQLRIVSAIIVKKDNKYLIVKKPRKDFAWQFPQGGVEKKETFLQAAKRELKEECGNNLSVKFKGEKSIGSYYYLFPKDFKRHEKNIIGAQIQIFEAEYLNGIVEVDNDEIIDFKWATYDELQKFFEKDYWINIKNFL